MALTQPKKFDYSKQVSIILRFLKCQQICSSNKKEASDRSENTCGPVAKNLAFCIQNCSDLP